MVKTQTLTIGAIYRRNFRVRLDELGLPYTEHRGLVDSDIIVKLSTPEHDEAYKVFARDCRAFMAQLAELDRQEEEEKLARKNRFRRLTFRKPLTSLK